MHNVVKKSITNALERYVEKGREAGFSDEELKRVCQETWQDSIEAMNRAARKNQCPARLIDLLRHRHEQMVERHNSNVNK